ncbi:unannotated protein [freshwater metagenome]|uniref:Unannotated protein n=1 Tax=freshwater metagenome TaxID=449393 RepID=A0A6J6ICR1_9ZZZZ
MLARFLRDSRLRQIHPSANLQLPLPCGLWRAAAQLVRARPCWLRCLGLLGQRPTQLFFYLPPGGVARILHERPAFLIATHKEPRLKRSHLRCSQRWSVKLLPPPAGHAGLADGSSRTLQCLNRHQQQCSFYQTHKTLQAF